MAEKVYKIYFDGQKYVVDENIMERPTSIGYNDLADKYIGGDINIANYYASALNSDINNGELRVVKCKDCNNYFVIDADGIEWYKTRGLMLPVRCHRCRQQKKKS